MEGNGKGGGFNVGASSESQTYMSLIVRLNANKCYQELLCYLSSYINLLNIRPFAWVFGLYVSATDDVTVTTPGFVLIVLLVISL